MFKEIFGRAKRLFRPAPKPQPVQQSAPQVKGTRTLPVGLAALFLQNAYPGLSRQQAEHWARKLKRKPRHKAKRKK